MHFERESSDRECSLQSCNLKSLVIQQNIESCILKEKVPVENISLNVTFWKKRYIRKQICFRNNEHFIRKCAISFINTTNFSDLPSIEGYFKRWDNTRCYVNCWNPRYYKKFTFYFTISPLSFFIYNTHGEFSLAVWNWFINRQRSNHFLFLGNFLFVDDLNWWQGAWSTFVIKGQKDLF